MKNFNYTARDKTGSTKRGSLKAADRNAAMHELSAQGMVPLSITEAEFKATPGLPHLKPLGIGAAIIVALAAFYIVFILLPKNSGSDSKKAKKTRVEQVTKKQPVKSVTKTATNTVVTVEKTSTEKAPVLAPSLTTNESVNPKLQVIELYPGGTTNPPLTGYSSNTERLINMIVNTRPGMPPPPLFNLPPGETNIVSILDSNILLYDSDDEKTAQQKANVAYAKQLLKEYLKEGGDTKNFLKFYHEQLTESFKERIAAQKRFIDLLKTGDEKAATEFYETQNKAFSEKGIYPLTLPPKMKTPKE